METTSAELKRLAAEVSSRVQFVEGAMRDDMIRWVENLLRLSGQAAHLERQELRFYALASEHAPEGTLFVDEEETEEGTP